jgi:hypothetical protein
LRSDIQNAEDFFARRGVRTLGLRRTFNLVTRDSWVSGRDETDDDVTEEVKRLLAEEEQEAAAPSGRQPDPLAERGGDRSASDEAVFAQSYIPRTLDQVYDVERDVARVLRGEGSDLIYADLTGVASVQKAQQDRSLPAVAEGDDAPEGVRESGPKGEDESSDDTEGSDESSDDTEGSDGSDSDDQEDADGVRRPRGKKFEDKDEKKVCLSVFSLKHVARILTVSVRHTGETSRSQGESSREARDEDEEGRESAPDQEVEREAMRSIRGIDADVHAPYCCVFSSQDLHAIPTASLPPESHLRDIGELSGCIVAQQAKTTTSGEQEAADRDQGCEDLRRDLFRRAVDTRRVVLGHVALDCAQHTLRHAGWHL